MGSKVNISIRDNFSVYQQLRSDAKTYNINPIELNQTKPNHVKTKIKCVDAKHSSINHKLMFCVESDKTDAKNFKFKLWCNELYNLPFFRFDSDGLTHKNDNPEIPLEEQQVTTPHFHAYDADGKEFAYKTDHLNNEHEKSAILNDINFAIAHFCTEANIGLHDGAIPQVIQVPNTELPFLAPIELDPMKNIKFI